MMVQGAGFEPAKHTHSDLNAAATAQVPLLGFRPARSDFNAANVVFWQGAGFEPAKHYALGPKPSPFDRSVPLLRLVRIITHQEGSAWTPLPPMGS